jgi:hypothetical protein
MNAFHRCGDRRTSLSFAEFRFMRQGWQGVAAMTIRGKPILLPIDDESGSLQRALRPNYDYGRNTSLTDFG